MNTLIRVLSVDDNPHDRALVRDGLEKEHGGFALTEAASRAEFEARLAALDCDVVLTDFNILGFHGLQVLEAVHAKDPQMPVVIVTGTGSEEVAVEAMRRGAADYVIKTPQHIQRLPHTVQAVLEKTRLEAERKQAEEALRRSETQMRDILDNSTTVVFVKDLQGRYLLINRRYEELFHIEREAVIGKTDYEIFPAEFATAFQDADRRALEAGRPIEAEEVVPQDDGIHHYLSIKFPLSGLDGKPYAVCGIATDITGRKHAEEQLLAANARLEQAVTRAEELAARAEAANVAKSEFLANMSHEIRTPMTAILGFSDLLTAPNLAYQEQRQFLAGIQRNGKALLELISDILDLSRIVADRLTLEKVDCPLLQVIDDVLSVVQVRAEEKGLSLHVDYTFPLPETIHTDPVRLRQVLSNLIGNAVKFTERGAVVVRVEARWGVGGPKVESNASLPSPIGRGVGGEGGKAETRDHELATSPHPSPLPEGEGTVTLQFAISDTGIGIPANKIDELFRPFMQVDASASRRYGGTGLGLVISRRLAKALGGDIEVTSEPGKGSTFTLTIDAGPLTGTRMLQSTQAIAPARKEPSPVRPGVTLHGRVLLVEDVPSVQLVLAKVLQQMNLQVEIAEDGLVACQMAEKSQAEGKSFDLILMDIQMPRMSGYEATRWLRQQGWRGPMVALTAHALVGDREKCLEAGCDDYIAKPITTTGLQDMLARYLGQEATPAGQVTAEEGVTTEPAGLLAGGLLDPSKVAALLDVFRGELPSRAELIEKAAQQHNRTLLFEVAHQLKGTAGVYGFDSISETARIICDRLRADDELEELQAAVYELVNLCRQAASHQPGSPSDQQVHP